MSVFSQHHNLKQTKNEKDLTQDEEDNELTSSPSEESKSVSDSSIDCHEDEDVRATAEAKIGPTTRSGRTVKK